MSCSVSVLRGAPLYNPCITSFSARRATSCTNSSGGGHGREGKDTSSGSRAATLVPGTSCAPVSEWPTLNTACCALTCCLGAFDQGFLVHAVGDVRTHAAMHAPTPAPASDGREKRGLKYFGRLPRALGSKGIRGQRQGLPCPTCSMSARGTRLSSSSEHGFGLRPMPAMRCGGGCIRIWNGVAPASRLLHEQLSYQGAPKRSQQHTACPPVTLEERPAKKTSRSVIQGGQVPDPRPAY